MVLAAAFTLLVLQPSIIPRKTFSAPESSYRGWEEILSSPQPITIQTYSTGVMLTELSGIMNLAHERAAAIEDVVVEAPVNASIIHHQTLGYYLIDAGLDSSYIDHQYGTFRGLFVEKTLGKGSQEPNTNIASVIKRKNIPLRGVWLTHLHPDHIAGIIDLPKHLPYVAGKGERYINFRFFMRSDHLAGIEALYEIDFTGGIDLPPFGRGIDLLGDGSFWAIESSGHSKGHVMYFINGIEERVLVTGDACNDQFQFDTGIGPGSFSSDLEQAQQVLETIITFKERYPEVSLVFGHDRISIQHE
ncbi:hypothetical protein CRP01_33475 [Flavilitoribacter nigricans DSM 23189 = NBRC 102662]|uniref:Metallo-beta-lactamase domain-containing protein n=2 Tax=Flavilitoribacter TaxID=2762562 RepID=A0A2D0N0M2_FLAN2|nr:hypothetical protein CRP01_33475 [Flavilitoribacter nigricans DSM 23189 = NBRC 102662]